ncbi:hypothetical protein [Bacteroides sp.]|uniref:hypothetical protein n=1 Tax=Bacteroides sp. TaxID=29523 RepID=UPI002602DA00|nr:hypothetical protein [Bacteroides sp.]MDD3039603.1 hypothetical protein [Bacteroides sp.]
MNTVEIAEEIYNLLLAERPADFTVIEEHQTNAWVLYYEPDRLYIQIKPDWQWGLYFGYVGVHITCSSSWDFNLYIPAGTEYYTTIVTFAHAAYNADPSYLDSEADRDNWWYKKIQCAYYSDSYGIHLWWRNPFVTEVDASRSGLFNLEFIQTSIREYNDAQSDIFINVVNHGSTFNDTEEQYNRVSARPFNYNSTTAMWSYPYMAFYSGGNDKTYFKFPWYYYDGGSTKLIPIFQTKRWFYIYKRDSNLLPWDIITWNDDGVERQFMIMDCATGTEAAPSWFVAMPYSSAKPYDGV